MHVMRDRLYGDREMLPNFGFPMEDLIGRTPRRKISCALPQGLKFSKGPLRGRGCAARTARTRAIRPESKKGLQPHFGHFWPFSDTKRCRVRSRWDFFCNFGAFGAYFLEK